MDVMLMVHGVVVSAEKAPDQLSRLLGFMLDGLCHSGGDAPPSPPDSPRAVLAVVSRGREGQGPPRTARSRSFAPRPPFARGQMSGGRFS